MNLRDLPILKHLGDVGPSDPVFDLMVLVGPVVVVLIILLGRNAATTAIAAGYVLAFPAYLAYKAVTRPSD